MSLISDLFSIYGITQKSRENRKEMGILFNLQIINGTYGKRMDVNLEYQWQSCGGILRGPFHTVKAPKNIPYPINCAWHMDYPVGETIRLSFTKLQFDLNCDRAYLIVR